MKRISVQLLAVVAILGCLGGSQNVFAQDGNFAYPPETLPAYAPPAPAYNAAMPAHNTMPAYNSCSPVHSYGNEGDVVGLGTFDGFGSGTIGGGGGQPWELFRNNSGINIGGWLSAGYHSESTGLFNTRPDEIQIHQAWLYIEKAADGTHGPDWGFRVDGMYGTDAADTQAFGNTPGRWDFQNGFDRGAQYGFAIPQAYLEYANGDWSVVAGHFYTLVGYEVVTAPDNFFYSHAYTMYNSEPFTHTGILGTWTVSDSIEFYGGWTAGWDTGFDRNNDGSNFIGGASFALTDKTSITYISTYGNFGSRGTGGDQYSHSVVVDTAVSDSTSWVVQSDYVDDNLVTQYGLNNYIVHTVNDTIGYGLRTEWWRNAGVSFYEVTLGMNYRSNANLVFRPEIRYDWSPAFDLDQFSFGIDAVLTF